jgi:hypothetical protein
MNHNKELIRKLAHGDKETIEYVKGLPLKVRMSLGASAEELRRQENIVPMNGGLSVFEKEKSKYTDDDVINEAMRKQMNQIKENEERAQKIKEEFIEKEVRANIDRARSGLPRNDGKGGAR